jgi:uncharacterized membrane protein
MSKNKKIVCVVVGIVVLVGVFYGGMVFGKSQTPARGQNMQGFGQNGVKTTKIGGNFGGATFGKIIAKDSKSITIQIMSGADSGNQIGSRIIFLGTDTTVTKQASSTLNDLVVGTEVTVRGTANTDGSVNAQSVQIVPANTINQKTPTPTPSVVQ